MGYEFESQKSKERKMKYFYILLLGTIISIGSVNAQTIDPNSMLGNELPSEPDVQEVPEQNIPDSGGGLQFIPLPLTSKCLSMSDMKGLVEYIMRQETLVIGYNGLAYRQMSPFDGLIIARNETSLEYTVLLINSNADLACIVAIGTKMQLKSEQNTE